MLEFLFALIVTLLVMAVLVLILGWQRPVRGGKIVGLVFLFVLLLFAIWAAGVWITPFGPAIGTVYWLPFLIAGLVLMLLFIVILPPSPRWDEKYSMRETGMESAPEKAAWAGFGIFFWFLVVFFALAIILSYR